MHDTIPDLQPMGFPGEQGNLASREQAWADINRLYVFTKACCHEGNRNFITKPSGSRLLQSSLTSSKVPPADVSENECF